MFSNKRNLSFYSLVFTLISGMSACSSKHNADTTTSGEDAALQDTAAPLDGGDSSTSKIDINDGALRNSGDGSSSDTTEATAQSVHRHHSGGGGARVKSAPFRKGNFWMNAFYFVRSPDEKWESLSQTLYGRPDRASLIKAWNKPKKLSPGTLVYYNSPLRPDDNQAMKVFAEDYGYPLEEIQAQAGDTMKSLAQQRYGQAASWREIAALNPDAKPNELQAGQVLRVQPVQIDTQATLAKLINQTAADSAKTAQAEQAPPAQPEANTAPGAPKDNNPSTAPPPEEAPKAQAPANSGWFGNDMLIKIAFGLLVLLALVVVVRRRAQKKNSDEWNDAADNVTKFDNTKSGL